MKTKRGISLLYAEDDPHARVLLEKLLHHEFPGLTVYAAADGEEGMALFNQHHPQLILTDIAMPNMDGVEMAKRIRTIDPDAVIIALTAYNDEEFQVRSKDLGLRACLSKPVVFNTLLKSVGDAIDSLSRDNGFGNGH